MSPDPKDKDVEEIRRLLATLKSRIAGIENGDLLRSKSQGFFIGDLRIFRGDDGHLYQRARDGTEIDLAETAATDPLWDALGDTLYGTGADTGAKLAGNTTVTKKFLTQTGDGAASAAPAWGTIVSGDVPASLANARTFEDGIKTDNIEEETAAAGVKIDSSATNPTLIKDNKVYPLSTNLNSYLGQARVNFDANDYLALVGDVYNFYIGGAVVGAISATGWAGIIDILKFGAATSITLDAGGLLTPVDHTYLSVRGNGLAADNLDTIAAGFAGQVILIRPGGAEDITVRHNQSAASGMNILLAGGAACLLDDTADTLLLIYDATLDTNGCWIEVARNVLPAHKTLHENAGADEISVAGLSGLLADDQHVLDTEVDARINALAVLQTLYDAYSILMATADNTPVALTVAEQRLIGRITGGAIDDLSPAQIWTILTGGAAASVAMASQKFTGLAAGSGAGDSVRFEQLPAAASTTVQGIIEVATAAETTTGTSASLAVSPDGLAGSDYGKRIVHWRVIDQATALATGEAKDIFYAPIELNGWNLVRAEATVDTVSSSGAITVSLERVRLGTGAGTVDMLSTSITIDANERTSFSAATASVVNGANDDISVVTGGSWVSDTIEANIDGVGTGSKGLVVILTFQLP